MKLKVATCQFPTSADIVSNRNYIFSQMRAAKAQGAQVAHFPEACLSGYAGADLPSYDGLDWSLLEQSACAILDLARELRLWTIVGSAHRLSGDHKPHNSLYIINDQGQLIDRYDKMFCAGNAAENTGDLAHYTPGNHFSVFEIEGVRCGTLICHEYRYPELYREYQKQSASGRCKRASDLKTMPLTRLRLCRGLRSLLPCIWPLPITTCGLAARIRQRGKAAGRVFSCALMV